MLVQPAVCGIYDLPPLSSFFLFLFSSIEKRKSFFTPQRGVFCSSWKRGKRLRPTFLFLSREKKKRAAPGTKKKSAGSGFRDESCSFFVRALCPDGNTLVLCGLVLPLAPLTLTSAGRVRFLLFGTGSICFQILQQHELNIICNRPVFLRCQFPDFIQHVLR